ncbi:MAG: hypothetical protein COX70_08245 [Flavobacteriales bacterium CG_4_10_14_0_2_um_filter_32_8]|nr:MAG: hypothetical protein COX70_08245 [Flavobacteriales bacterium CG_4_10_14_0_2_um_filter_32_8]PJB15648.1 MAG: hypothetical protein CO118_02680 [Flavobacteriales bacterium CG_4_9_14_3_um_filter_32_8]
MSFFKYLIIIVVLLNFSVNTKCFAQNFSVEEQHQIDTLNRIIYDIASYDTSKANAYLTLAEILYVSNLDTIIPLCEKAKNIAEKALNKLPKSDKNTRKAFLKSLTGALNNIGYAYLAKGNTDKAIEYYHKAKPISEEIDDKEALFTYYISIGYIYMEKGEIKKALKYYHQSLKIAEAMGNKQNIATSLNNIGYIYEHQDDFDKGLEFYYLSLEKYKEIDYQQGIADLYNNISVVYNNQAQEINKKGENYDLVDIKREKALSYQQKSLKIRREIGDKEGISASLNIIGGIYASQAEELIKYGGNTNTINTKRQTALENLYESLKIRKEIGDKDGMTYSLNSIAKILIAQEQYQQAFDYVNRSFQISKELGYPKNIRNAAHLLSEIYKKQNKGTQALEMFELYINMRDSINNEETQKSTIKQQAKYEYEKQKVIDDLEYQKIIAVKQAEKKKQQIVTISTAAILILVVVFLLFVFNRLKITRKQKLVIEEKNIEITDSINYAKRIQEAILPSRQSVKELLPNSFIYYQPKDIVAGDFYWVESISSLEGGLKVGDNHPSSSPQGENIILFAAADCTGHGVPGALVSVVCNNALNRATRDFNLTNPGQLLDKTSEIVENQLNQSTVSSLGEMDNIRDGMDIALCMLNTKTNELQYAGAKNPLWIIRNAEDDIEEIKANKQSIGKVENRENYTTHSIQLNKGDTIYIFSDGFADQFGGDKGKKLMYQPFKKLLIEINNETMDKQLELIRNYFEKWKGNLEQVDDVCIIGVRV